LIPNQEIDGRQITGVAYWEGAVRVLDDGDREIGLGYLELTGYHRAFRL
jgi:predicted secreted hydrolase